MFINKKLSAHGGKGGTGLQAVIETPEIFRQGFGVLAFCASATPNCIRALASLVPAAVNLSSARLIESFPPGAQR